MATRRGLTLVELVVVLALIALTAAAAIPAFAAARRDPEADSVDAVVALMTRARDGARERGESTELVIAPRDARFWMSSGASTSTGALQLAPAQRIVGSDSDRVVCRFSAQGTATPCAIALRGARDVIVRVNAWTGAISAEAQRR